MGKLYWILISEFTFAGIMVYLTIIGSIKFVIIVLIVDMWVSATSSRLNKYKKELGIIEK